MPEETFFQRFTETRGEITCWWAIRKDVFSFLVIDETNGLSASTSFELRAGDDGNIGILTHDGAEQALSGTGAVVHITLAGTFVESIPMTAAQVSEYLGSGDFPLTLAGAREYARANSRR